MSPEGGESRTKTAVAYVTKGGATATYARIIADVLASAGHQVELIDLKQNRKPDLADYHNVVLGTGVRIGMVYRVAKRFLRRNDFDDKRLAIFLSSGIAIDDAKKSKAKFLDPLLSKYGLDPIMYDAFPGKTPGPADETPDTTDPDRVRKWAEDLAAQLAAAATG